MSLLALHLLNPLARLCSPSHSGGPEELFTLPSSSEEIAPDLFLPDFVGVRSPTVFEAVPLGKRSC